jgi:hypothetical protein
MGSPLEELHKFVDHAVSNEFFLTPDPGSLKGYRPKADVKVRDEHKIIVQHDVNDEKATTGDGGDSAMRTGIMAFCNSPVDANLLPLFELAAPSLGIMVRHPYQSKKPDKCWNDPNNCSRDQLISFAAGCWRVGNNEIVQRILARHIARGLLCQNIYNDCPPDSPKPPDPKTTDPKIPDPLGPHEVMYLRACAGDNLALVDPLGQMALLAAIRALRQGDEINAMIVESIVCCQLDAFLHLYQGNWEQELRNYWGASRRVARGQPEIAEAIIDVVNIENERYLNLTRNYLLWDIPWEVLAVFLDECLAILHDPTKLPDPIELLDLAKRFAYAAAKDLGREASGIVQYVTDIVNWIRNDPSIVRALPSLDDPIEAIIELTGYFDKAGQKRRRRRPPPNFLASKEIFKIIGIDI